MEPTQGHARACAQFSLPRVRHSVNCPLRTRAAIRQTVDRD